MKLPGNLLSRFKKTSNHKNNEFDDDSDLPVMGREESGSGKRAKEHHNKDHADDYEQDENEGLPSVNRRSNSITNIIGLGMIVVIGVIALFSVGGKSNFKPREAERKAEISSHLPALELPAPAPPAPIAVNKPISPVPPINSAQPIPLQNNQPQEISWYDRKLSGGLLVGDKEAQPTTLSKVTETASNLGTATQNTVQPQSGTTSEIAQVLGALSQKPEPPKEDLFEKLKPTITQGVKAELLPNRNFVVAKGTALDCALETAIDTTVPGLITCRLTRDVYSDNGHVVMLDRGSQLVGEYKGGIKDGEARVFVLWTRAKTPNGVVVALDSPGTDALGRAGIAGWVDHHYAERFGAAILTSIIKDVFATIAYTAARNNNGNTQISIGNTSRESESIGVEILKRTAGAPPTLYVNQGAHVQIMVARDLDFTSVYSLELKK
jgi:type IV secretion system protein VirB10